MDQEAARAAVAAAAAARLEPGMLLGLGSGRAVWALIDMLERRWAGRPLRVVVASSTTEARAAAAGFEIVSLDGTIALDVAVDGADQIDRGHSGGGSACTLSSRMTARMVAPVRLRSSRSEAMPRSSPRGLHWTAPL